MKIIDRVENILKASHMARNSDKELFLIYMQKSGMNLSTEQINLFRKMPSLETLRRSRQLLQEQGKYLADKEVDESRFKKYQSMKYGIKHQDPEELLKEKGYRVLPWGQN